MQLHHANTNKTENTNTKFKEILIYILIQTQIQPAAAGTTLPQQSSHHMILIDVGIKFSQH